MYGYNVMNKSKHLDTQFCNDDEAQIIDTNNNNNNNNINLILYYIYYIKMLKLSNNYSVKIRNLIINIL